MTYSELTGSGLTYGDLANLTWGQLELDKMELLFRIARGEITVSKTVYQKILTLCQKVIDDYNSLVSIGPDKAIENPVDDSDANDCDANDSDGTGASPTRPKHLNLLLKAVVAIIGALNVSHSVPLNVDVDINSHNVAIEHQTIYNGINELLATASNAVPAIDTTGTGAGAR